MATSKNILKDWFRNRKKPPQEHFWAWLDSYWHKDEKIPVERIKGLDAVSGGDMYSELLNRIVTLENKKEKGVRNDAVFTIKENEVKKYVAPEGAMLLGLILKEEAYISVSDTEDFANEIDLSGVGAILDLGFSNKTEVYIKSDSDTTLVPIIYLHSPAAVPVITITQSPKEKTSGSVVLTAIASVDVVVLAPGWTTVNDRKFTLETSKNGSFGIRVRDKDGNVLSAYHSVDNIEKNIVVPTIHITQHPQSKTSGKVTLTAICSEDITVNASGWKALGARKYVFETSKNGLFGITGTNSKGIVASATHAVNNIEEDVNNIKVIISQEPEEPTTGKVILTAICSEDVIVTAPGWETITPRKFVLETLKNGLFGFACIRATGGGEASASRSVENIIDPSVSSVITITQSPLEKTNGEVTLTAVSSIDLTLLAPGWDEINPRKFILKTSKNGQFAMRGRSNGKTFSAYHEVSNIE